MVTMLLETVLCQVFIVVIFIVIIIIIIIGWQGRSPIFLPVNKCMIRIVVEPSINNENPIDAKTLYQLSNFKIFATVCNNTKHGIKLLFEYSNEFFKTQAANSTIPGGFSALNFAALHGNLEVVE